MLGEKGLSTAANVSVFDELLVQWPLTPQYEPAENVLCGASMLSWHEPAAQDQDAHGDEDAHRCKHCA